MLEVTTHLNKNSKEPLYIQLSAYLKAEIRNGNIKDGEKLPSKRNLANHLEISQNTVDNAYQQLYAEGYIESRPRKGMFVTYTEPNLFIYKSSLDTQKRKQHFFKDSTNAINIDFNPGDIDITHFPYRKWKKYTIESITSEKSQLFFHGHPQGDILLREQIASHLYQSRGVKASPNQIIIGSGNQYLIIMLLQLLNNNPHYGIENPGFCRIRNTFQKFGEQVSPVTVDKHGMNVKHLSNTMSNIAYVTPSHQFPLGVIMPISRRLELLNWAYESTDRFIIEDDYDGEFRYTGKPIPSLQGLDTQDKVIYLGTFSKSLIPSLRISYMVLPIRLIEAYDKNYQFHSQTVSRFHQNTLYLFMNNGDWERHLNKMRSIYKRKRQIFLSSIQERFKEKVSIIGQNSGLHIVVEIKNNMNEEELITSALSKGVKVYPCSVHYYNVGESNPRLLLGFGGLTEDEIKNGINLLAEEWL